MTKSTDLREAFRRGEDIQCLDKNGKWVDCNDSTLLLYEKYRIKPVVSYIIMQNDGSGILHYYAGPFKSYEESLEYINNSDELNLVVINLNDSQKETDE